MWETTVIMAAASHGSKETIEAVMAAARNTLTNDEV